MLAINIYLTFNGCCEKAFIFYRTILGGHFEKIIRYKDIPDHNISAESKMDGPKIAFILLVIENTIIIGRDLKSKQFAPTGQYTVIRTSSKKEAEKLFYKFTDKGGEILIHLAYTLWGDYLGIVKDPYNIEWMILYDQKLNTRNDLFEQFYKNYFIN